MRTKKQKNGNWQGKPRPTRHPLYRRQDNEQEKAEK